MSSPLPHKVFYTKALPLLSPKLTSSYKTQLILTADQKKETIGYCVKSLIGALNGKKGEGYIKILQDRTAGQFTVEHKDDLPEVKAKDRFDISTKVKSCLKKRHPFGAAKRTKLDADDEDGTTGRKDNDEDDGNFSLILLFDS